MSKNSKSERNNFVDLRHAARDSGYHDVIADILDIKKCPFCPENFKWHKKPTLAKERGWFITENTWPYENAKHHFLIIPKKHIVTIDDVSDEDFNAVKKLTRVVSEKHNITGGGLTLRFGDSTFTGSTVTHLHFHLIVPELERGEKTF